MRRLYYSKSQGQADPKADKLLVNTVLDHARRVISHPSRPTVTRTESYTLSPFGELAIEETLDENPLFETPDEVLVQYSEDKPFSCVAILDASSSMSGEKHLLASVAVAVLLLEVKPEDVSLVVFASDTKVIKPMGVVETVDKTVLRFLQTVPRGFTNIEKGLKTGLQEAKAKSGRKKRVGLIATDGRTTEGGDPIDYAKQFDYLVVLHLHGPGSYIEASQAIAEAGHGICLEVDDFSALPRRLYDALRVLARQS